MQYLVILSVGPVQSMIAAARKSRDLWSGSALLSELAKACALSLQQQGAELIFPAIEPNDIKSLQPNSPISVGNKIQAQITVDHVEQLKAIIAKAKQATQQRFINEANNVKQDNIAIWSGIRSDVWQKQADDYVEVQSAWALIDAQKQPYPQAVDRTGNTLAARKATRDFGPLATDPYDESRMIPKSSLDGARETVLQEEKNLDDKTRLKLGLSQSEQLDCIGVVKRLGLKGQAEQFTPFTRVAVHPWIEKVLHDETSRHQLQDVKECYERLVRQELATRVSGNKNNNGQSIYQDFPYDAQLLYRSRLEAELENNKEPDAANDALKDLQRALKPLWQRYGQPTSYGVLLLADGDRMGELLDKAQDITHHKHITRALSGFAQSVADTMQDYEGHCIYAGGDDVLGFVPLHQAYACAEALSQSFKDALSEVAQKLGVDKSPTLSVGLAIAHIMTPLGIIRDLAQQAEKYAKGDHIEEVEKRRNALGICLDVRSGNITKLRFPWNDTDAHQAFNAWIDLYKGKQIPSRIAYDTRAVELRTRGISTNLETQQGIQSAEFKRMLDKARLAAGGSIPKETQEKLSKRAQQIGLQLLSDELIVARWFAAKTGQDLGKDGQ